MASTEESSVPNPDDCFKILLATDIHLGYKETDDIIGTFFQNSYETSQIFWIAVIVKEWLQDKNTMNFLTRFFL